MSISLGHGAPAIQDPTSADSPQVVFPDDLEKWAAYLRSSVNDYGYLCVAVGSTAMPGTAAIVLCAANEQGGPAELLTDGFGHLGFIVDHRTLVELGAAINAMIVATRQKE